MKTLVRISKKKNYQNHNKPSRPNIPGDWHCHLQCDIPTYPKVWPSAMSFYSWTSTKSVLNKVQRLSSTTSLRRFPPVLMDIWPCMREQNSSSTQYGKVFFCNTCCADSTPAAHDVFLSECFTSSHTHIFLSWQRRLWHALAPGQKLHNMQHTGVRSHWKYTQLWHILLFSHLVCRLEKCTLTLNVIWW